MSERGHFLLMTPVDLLASSDQLVRQYELVRRNIAAIAPSLPSDAEIDIFSGGTPHNSVDIPLLGVHFPDWTDSDAVCDELQDRIDVWFSRHSKPDLDAMIAAIDYPLWPDIQRLRSYPCRKLDDAQDRPKNGG